MSEKFPERNARIRELRAQGMGQTAIARELGITLGMVASVFWRDDHPWHRPHRKRPSAEAVAAVNARFA